MTRGGFRMAMAGAAFALLARAAWANPGPMVFDELSTGVLLIVFFSWLFVGAILSVGKVDLTHFGLAGYAQIFIFTFMGVFDVGLLIWACYVGLLVLYYLFPRTGVPRQTRLINLGFHGFSFLVIVAAGIIAKISYFGEHGGYYRWIAHMRENYPEILIYCLVIMGLVSMQVDIRVIRANRQRTPPPEPTQSPEPTPETPADKA